MARPCGKKAALSCLWRTGNTRLFTATVLLAAGALLLLHAGLRAVSSVSSPFGGPFGPFGGEAKEAPLKELVPPHHGGTARNLDQSKQHREARRHSFPRGEGHHSTTVKQMGGEVQLAGADSHPPEETSVDLATHADAMTLAKTTFSSAVGTPPPHGSLARVLPGQRGSSADGAMLTHGETDDEHKPAFTSSRIIQLSSAYRRPLANVDEAAAVAAAAAAAAASASVSAVDPLELQVTHDWEQISAELWSALSRGVVPALPVPPSPGESSAGVEDDENPDALAKMVVKNFIKAAAGDGPHRVQSLFDEDDRCKKIWELLKDEVDNKLNSSLLEIGAGEGLSTIGASTSTSGTSGTSNNNVGKLLALIDDSTSDNEGLLLEDFDPFDRSRPKGHGDGDNSKSDECAPRIHGCVGIKAAQHLERSTVVFVGDPSRPVFGRAYEPKIPVPSSVAGVRDALDKRTINHVSCDTSVALPFLDNVLLDVPETFTYQVLSDLAMLPGNSLPHEFEVFLGKLLSLSISTFIPTPLPNDRFFSYWRSAADLANAAARAVDLEVVISHTGEDENPTNNDWRYNWRNNQGSDADKKIYKEEEIKGLLRVDLGDWKMVEVKTKIEDDDKKDGSDSSGSDNSDSSSGSDGGDDEDKFEISYEKQLLPVPSNHSDQGVSILTIASAGISSADQERIFTMMLREEREGIISHNGAAGTRFIRGALHFGESIDAFGEIKSGSAVSGVDSMEHDKKRKARLNIDGKNSANAKKSVSSDAKEKKTNAKEGYASLASLADDAASSDAEADETFSSDRDASKKDAATPNVDDKEEADNGDDDIDDSDDVGDADLDTDADYLRPKIVEKIMASAAERAEDRRKADKFFMDREKARSGTQASKKPKVHKLKIQDAALADGVGENEEGDGSGSSSSSSSSSSSVTFEGLDKITNEKKASKTKAKTSAPKTKTSAPKKTPAKKNPVTKKKAKPTKAATSSKQNAKTAYKASTTTDEKADKSSTRLRGGAAAAASSDEHKEAEGDADLMAAQRQAEKEALLAVMKKRRAQMQGDKKSGPATAKKTKQHPEGIFDVFKTQKSGGSAYAAAHGKKKVSTRRRRLLARRLTASGPQHSQSHGGTHVSERQERVPRMKKWAKEHIEDQLQMVAHEEAGYRRWWPLFKSDEIMSPTSDAAEQAHAVLVHGRGLGLLSTKIALKNRRSTVVTMKYQADDREAHLSLTELLGIHNNLLCETPITTATTSALLFPDANGASMPPFRYSAVGLDIFQRLIRTVDSLSAFEAQLGAILALSVTSFVELPVWEVLASALDTILNNMNKMDDQPDGSKADQPLPSASFSARYEKLAKSRGSDDPWVGLLSAAVQAAQLDGVTMRVLSFDVPVDTVSFKNAGKAYGNAAAGGDAAASDDKNSNMNNAADASDSAGGGDGYYDPDASPGRFSPRSFVIPTVVEEEAAPEKKPKLTKMTVVRVDTRAWGKKGASLSSAPAMTLRNVGVDLKTLLSLGVIPQQKRHLLRMFLRLPFANIEAAEGLSVEIAPHKIIYVGHGGGADHAHAQLLFTPSTKKNAKNAPLYRGTQLDASARVRAEARLHEDPRFGALMNEMITEDTEGGEFSFIEYNSGSGLLSAAVAERYPRATIISVETEDMHVEAHLRRLKRLAQSKVDIAGADLQSQRDGHGGGGGAESMQRLADVGANNWVCKTEESVHDMLTKLYESPEFVRYGVFTGDLVLEHMIDSKGYRELADPIGKLMSTAMTTFFSLPSARAISLALSTFFHVPAATSAPAMYALSAHPRPRYQNAEMQILSTIGRVPGKTKLSMRLIPGGSSQHMVRVDIVNMTRHVHHHFDYQKDGHQRRYKMHVLRNSTLTKLAAQMRKKQGSGGKPLAGDAYRKALAKMVPEGSHPNRGTVTSVYITREHDAWHIPYGTLYGITLITVLRLGLVKSQREIAYHNFVALPLYEDMAPWNIVFQGSRMAYIDYDTKDVTYDNIVPLTYKTLSVLFNYKRTVEDFRKCGPSGHNPYGFSHVSNCVGNTDDFKANGGEHCEESAAPVKCGDGSCQPDYISCLKVLSTRELRSQRASKMDSHERLSRKHWTDTAYARLLTEREWEFNQEGMVAPKKPTNAKNDGGRKKRKKSKANMNPGMGLRRVPLPPHDD